MNNEQFITLIIAKLKTIREKTKKEYAMARLPLPAHESEDKSLIKNLTLATDDRQLELLKKLITTYRDAIKEYQQVVNENYPITSKRDTLIKRHIVYPPLMGILDERIKQSVETQNNVLLEQFIKQNYPIDNDDRKMINIYVQDAKAANIRHKEIAAFTTDANQLAKDLQGLTKKADYVKPISGLLQDIDNAKRTYDAAIQEINRATNENKRYEEITNTRQLAKKLIHLIDLLEFTIARIKTLSPINFRNTADTDQILNQAKLYLTSIDTSNLQNLLDNIPHANDVEVQTRDKALAYLNALKLRENDLRLDENSEISVTLSRNKYILSIHDTRTNVDRSLDLTEAEFKKFARFQDIAIQKDRLEVVGLFEFEFEFEFEDDIDELNPPLPSAQKLPLSKPTDDHSAISGSQTINMGELTKKASAFANSYRSNAETIRSLLTDQRHVANLSETNAENFLQKYKKYIEYMKTDYQGYIGAAEYIDQQAGNHLNTLYATVFKKNNADKANQIDSILSQIAGINRLPKTTGSFKNLQELRSKLSELKQDTKLPGMVEYIHMQEQKLAKESTRTSILQLSTHRLISHSNRQQH